MFFVCFSLPDLIYFDALNKQNKKWGKEEAQKREGLFLVISWMMIGCVGGSRMSYGVRFLSTGFFSSSCALIYFYFF